MKKGCITIVLFVFCCSNCIAGPGDSLDVVSILEKAIEVRGGKSFLQSVKTLYTNTITTLDGIEVNGILKEMLPNKVSFQLENSNRIIYRSWFDGHQGFEMLKGKKKKQGEKENEENFYRKNIIKELDYIDPSLWKITLLGEENIATEACYKIKAVLINGLVKYLYYSKTSFLLLKEEKIPLSPNPVLRTCYYFNYRKTGQLLHYSKMKILENGKYRDIQISEIVINDQVNDSDFE